MPSFYSSFHVLPIIVAVLMVVAPTAAFILAVSLGHIESMFPYLLDAPSEPPERCFYAQLMFIAILLYIITIFVRYVQINYIYDKYNIPDSIRYINIACLVSGILGHVGICLSYNFPTQEQPVPHHFGTSVGITFMNVNCLLNTALTNKTAKILGYPFWMKWLRMLLSYMLMFEYFLLFGFRLYALHLFEGEYIHRLHWSSKNNGWVPHVISVVCEWKMILVFGIYLLTFTGEFTDIVISEPIVVLKKKLQPIPTMEPVT